MKSDRRARIALALVLAALAGLGSAATANGSAESPLRVAPAAGLQQSLRSLLNGAADLGEAAPGASAHALIALRPRHLDSLRHLVGAVSDPNGRSYGHYLTPARWNARFAPTVATVDAVSAFAQAVGLRVVEVPSNRAYVYVTGTVAAAERAFSTRIEDFRLPDGRDVQAPLNAPTVPAALGQAVLQVKGLNTADVAVPEASPPPAYVTAPPCSAYFGQTLATGATPVYGAKTAPPIVPCGYTPQQLRSAYGLTQAISHGIDGRGQVVAVIDAYSSPRIVPDAQTWSARHGLPRPELEVDDTQAQRNALQIPPVLGPLPNLLDVLPIGLPGVGSGNPQGWSEEETLDVEAVHAVAPAAKIVYEGADSDNASDLNRAQNAVVAADKAQIISNSYGGTADVSDPTTDAIWMQAAAEGIGVYFSSGDNGDETGGSGDLSKRQVDEGANSPFVTAVGGTSLAVDGRSRYGFETYWGTYSDNLTASGYAHTPPGSFLYGGGGGTSEAYAEPPWQLGVVPQRFSSFWAGKSQAVQGATIPGRVVPDMAIDGDPQTGLLIGQVQDFDAYKNPVFGAQASDRDVHYSEYRIGGTSLSSPLFAGIMALADQAAGMRHGFANPALYGSALQQAFHDVNQPAATVAVVRTNYNNSTNAAAGTTRVLRTTGQTVTLTSAPGFDDSTGLGSPRGLAFLHALAPKSQLVTTLLGQYGPDGTKAPAVHRRKRARKTHHRAASRHKKPPRKR